MHRRRVFCVEERGEERAGDDRRREKAGVPLLGFFTEVEASSDICAEELKTTLLQNIQF